MFLHPKAGAVLTFVSEELVVSVSTRGYFPLSGQELVEAGTGAPQEQLTSIISQSNTIQHQ